MNARIEELIGHPDPEVRQQGWELAETLYDRLGNALQCMVDARRLRAWIRSDNPIHEPCPVVGRDKWHRLMSRQPDPLMVVEMRNTVAMELTGDIYLRSFKRGTTAVTVTASDTVTVCHSKATYSEVRSEVRYR